MGKRDNKYQLIAQTKYPHFYRDIPVSAKHLFPSKLIM